MKRACAKVVLLPVAVFHALLSPRPLPRQGGGVTCVLRPTLAGNHRGSRNVASSRRGCTHAVTDTANGACARRRHHHPAASTVHPVARRRRWFPGWAAL